MVYRNTLDDLVVNGVDFFCTGFGSLPSLDCLGIDLFYRSTVGFPAGGTCSTFARQEDCVAIILIRRPRLPV